jgi:hypothetical protein
MNRVFCTIVLAFGVVAFVGLQMAKALPTKASVAFTWKYEMDVSPDTQNLDGNVDGESNPIMDFRFAGSSSHSITTDDSMTILHLDMSAENARLASDQTGQIWQTQMTYAAGFTVEARVKVSTSTGSLGAMTLDPAVGTGDFYNLATGETSWGSPYGTPKQTLDSNDNSSGYHVFRLAQLPGENSFSAWRDGVLIGSGLTGGFTFGTNLALGSEGSIWRGTADVDYLRFTAGAYEPLPEPSSMALLTAGLIGLLAYAWRKRG